MSFRESIRPLPRVYSDDKGWSSSTKLYHAKCRPYRRENEYAVIDDDAIDVLKAIDCGWPEPTLQRSTYRGAPFATHIVRRTGLPLWRVLEVGKTLKGEYLACLDDEPWCLLEDGLFLLQQLWADKYIP